MHRLAVALLGLVPMMAGCFGMCGYTPEAAVWVEEGLFDHLEADPPQGAHRSGGHDSGFPFAADVGGVRPASLQSLHWEGDLGGGAMSLETPGVLSLGARGTMSEQDVRGAFRRFAANVSEANASALQSAEDAFVASGARAGVHVAEHDNGTVREVPFVSYRGTLPGPYRFEEFYADSEAQPAATPLDPYADTGRVSAHGQGFGWVFSVPSWTVPLPEGSITVDGLDRVKVAGVFQEGDDDADVQRKALEAFDDAGLPRPDLAGMQHGGSIC